MELLQGTWHWSVSGFLIGIIMLTLIYFGKTFGMSSNLRTLCSMVGAGKFSDFFRLDWREQKWNLAVVFGAMIGGYVSTHFLSNNEVVLINDSTLQSLTHYGIDLPEGKLVPDALFGSDVFFSLKGILTLFFGGILIGFGTRYAGGCTSGHAISGLSNLQFPSLLAVVGFFIGGLLMIHVFFPLLFN